MDADAVKSTLTNLAYGNVMAAAARDLQKEMVAKDKAQTSKAAYDEVDLDELMDDPELEKLHADRIASLKVPVDSHCVQRLKYLFMDKRISIGDNRPEDVRWLLSLSEPELDLVISLKELALQRAKVVGHENLANKFDLKILRALSYILLQRVQDQINDLQFTGVDKLKEMLDECNLNKLDLGDKGSSEDVQDK